MKRPALAIIAFAALSTASAIAADMRVKASPPLAVFSWTGVYIGGNIGYGWKTADGARGCTDEFGV
jgi:outer membrane immunogenic protein